MKAILNHLYEHKALSKEEAKTILKKITFGQYNDAQIASFLTTFIMRQITLQELEGFREALIDLCIPIDLSAYDPMDLCGTGGDGKNTFNISTLSSFVVAGAGIPVAKHGNYGVSSVCGSSNVLESLGVVFTNEEEKLREQIEKAGITFLHAPLFHPAMKNVAPVRKEMGVKTFFNMLGPLVNPSRPKKQLVGVFSLEMARIYNYLFQKMEHQYSIVHSMDGFDEISLTGDYKVISNFGEQINTPYFNGFKQVVYEDLFGGDTVEEAAAIFMNVLNNKGTEAQEIVVIANATVAIKTYDPELSDEDAREKATDSLKGLKALESLNKLLETC